MLQKFLMAHCLLVVALASACRPNGDAESLSSAPAGAAGASPDGTRAAPPLLAPYPRAAWRVADLSQLEHTVMWVSHLLVRFDEGKNNEVNFSLADWYSVLPPPTRSREQALVLAREIADKARSRPQSFAELARQYSEDITTRELGGSLGGVTLSQLSLWPQVLDTLAAIGPGQASEVVETWYGFHIFYRAAPPAEATVSGAHLVIGHEQARWLPILARGALPQRSRTDALVLATEIYEAARRNPQSFDALVERYSEHRSAAVGGDFGSYSTREPNPFPRHVEVLSRLAEGEVAPPIDSPVGFEILRRTPARHRPTYAAQTLWLEFDPSAAEPDPSSRASVLARATTYAEQVAGDAERFAALRREVCCAYDQQWPEGRGTPALTLLLQKLGPGEVAKVPVQSEFNYVLARRIDATTSVDPALHFELPVPERVALGFHFSNIQGSFLAVQLRRVAEKAGAELELDTEQWRRLLELHLLEKELDDGIPAAAGRRRALLDGLLDGVRQLIGEEKYARYGLLLDQHFRSYLLDPTNETAIPRLLE
jgi:hypothetical protein